MPIIGNFPGGSGGSGGGGLVLASVTGIKALSAAGKVPPAQCHNFLWSEQEP